MEEKKQLTFYPKKCRLVLFILFTGALSVFGTLLFVESLKEIVYPPLIFGVFLAVIFGWMTLKVLKKLVSIHPYLILTKTELTIHPYEKNEVSIEWKDILEFQTIYTNFQKYIEIVLFNEEKYNSKSLAGNGKNIGSRIPTFVIVWGMIKRKDRDELLGALWKIHSQAVDTVLTEEELNKMNQREEKEDNITHDYFIRSYRTSLFISIFIIIIFYLIGDETGAIPIVLVLFVLYPFAKLIYDLLIGFKINRIVEKQVDINIYFWELYFLIDLIIYILTIFIAPFGIIYILFKYLQDRLRKSR